MTWLIEDEIFQDDEKPLVAALNKLGVPHVISKFGKPYEETLASLGAEPATFHGSLQFGRLIKNTTGHNVRVYCNLPKYECLYYYPRLGTRLINYRYCMLPFGDLIRQRAWIFQTFGRNGQVFLRPSSGYKTFTGKVMKDDEWVDELRNMRTKIDPEQLVVVAPAYPIRREWRMVVVGDNVITGGQYYQDGKSVRNADVPGNVYDFARTVLAGTDYWPDKAWVLDIGEYAETLALGVVEPNSFSCAGLYACDYERVVQAVNAIQ